MNLILLGLATWRLSSLIVNEDGPGAIFARIRRLAGTERPGQMSGMATLFSCLWCVSIWIAVAMYWVLKLAPMVLYVLSASTIVILIETVRNARNH